MLGLERLKNAKSSDSIINKVVVVDVVDVGKQTTTTDYKSLTNIHQECCHHLSPPHPIPDTHREHEHHQCSQFTHEMPHSYPVSLWALSVVSAWETVEICNPPQALSAKTTLASQIKLNLHTNNIYMYITYSASVWNWREGAVIERPLYH